MNHEMYQQCEAGIIIFSCTRNLQCLYKEVREFSLMTHLKVVHSTFFKCTTFMDYVIMPFVFRLIILCKVMSTFG